VLVVVVRGGLLPQQPSQGQRIDGVVVGCGVEDQGRVDAAANGPHDRHVGIARADALADAGDDSLELLLVEQIRLADHHQRGRRKAVRWGLAGVHGLEVGHGVDHLPGDQGGIHVELTEVVDYHTQPRAGRAQQVVEQARLPGAQVAGQGDHGDAGGHGAPRPRRVLEAVQRGHGAREVRAEPSCAYSHMT